MPTFQSHLLGALGVAGLMVSPALAHVEVGSGPAIANANNVVTFTVGHGCPGIAAGDPNIDTFALKITIPANVTGVRVVGSTLGKATLGHDAQGNVTTVTFSKAALTEASDSDEQFYQATLRFKTPDAPFARLLFTAEQTCKKPDGTTATVMWDALPGATGEPAAALVLTPAHVPGWNKYAIGTTTHIADADFATVFQNAQIVWRGTAAYSANPSVAAQIAATAGVTPLTGGIHPGDEIWVRY